MTLFNAGGFHRGNFNYQTVLDAFDILEGSLEDNRDIAVEMGDALLHCYEFLPELMDDTPENEDMSRGNTPTNFTRVEHNPVTEESFFVDNSNELVYLEAIYQTFPFTETV
jgi:hypothetical protein